eukprot:scaffold92131_cov35-Tisochrysis_lutea.AAC.2
MPMRTFTPKHHKHLMAEVCDDTSNAWRKLRIEIIYQRRLVAVGDKCRNSGYIVEKLEGH